MNDCQNVAVREALPDLAHGGLGDAERVVVLRHLDVCVDCTDELALIRSVIALGVSGTPRIHARAIAESVPAYHSRAPGNRFSVTWVRLAAAVVIGAAGVSALVLQHERSVAGTTGTSASVGARVASAPGSQTGVALVGTAELSDDHLAQLIESMPQIDAAPPAEPDPMISPTYDGDAS